jgi:hypothetical protein
MGKQPEHFRTREIKRCFNCTYSDNVMNRCTKHNFCYQDFLCESICDDWKYRWEDERIFKNDKLVHDVDNLQNLICALVGVSEDEDYIMNVLEKYGHSGKRTLEVLRKQKSEDERGNDSLIKEIAEIL